MALDKNGKQLPPGIRQRSNGRYEGRVQYDGGRHSVYADTLTELKKKMTETRYKLEHGDFVASSNTTVDDWFKAWIEQYKVNQVKEGTVTAYQDNYRYYIKKSIGDRKLTDIRGEHIQKLYNDLAREKKSFACIRLVSAILNNCFKQALKNGLIERNPVPLATLPKAAPKKPRRVFTKEEQELFFKYAEGSYLYNLFALAIRTGLRSGEVRGLKLSDIDRTAGVIYVKRTLKKRNNGEYFEDTPKTATSMREIPLTKDMLSIIERQKHFYGEKIVHMDGYVFHLPEGGPISIERMQGEIDRIIKLITEDDNQFERFTSHCFRHTFATRAIENGMKPQTLKVIMGHSSLSMTMDLYSHVLPTTKAEEMDLIAKAF